MMAFRQVHLDKVPRICYIVSVLPEGGRGSPEVMMRKWMKCIKIVLPAVLVMMEVFDAILVKKNEEAPLA